MPICRTFRNNETLLSRSQYKKCWAIRMISTSSTNFRFKSWEMRSRCSKRSTSTFKAMLRSFPKPRKRTRKTLSALLCKQHKFNLNSLLASRLWLSTISKTTSNRERAVALVKQLILTISLTQETRSARLPPLKSNSHPKIITLRNRLRSSTTRARLFKHSYKSNSSVWPPTTNQQLARLSPARLSHNRNK